VTPRIPVVATLAEYRVAVAGLPTQTELAVDAAGAIVVVDGATRWWDAAAAAVDAGASAVLVAEPRDVPLVAVGDLAADAPVPIVVHRARLRGDLVALAVEHREGTPPRIVVAECRAAASELTATVRDAVGWVRSLAGVTLDLAAASIGPESGTALLRSHDGTRAAGSMILTVTRPEAAILRVQALGETTTEVELDVPVGRTELATSTGSGRRVAPTLFEAAERAALRRTIAAIAAAAPLGALPDLADLLHDARAADAIMRSGRDRASLVDL